MLNIKKLETMKNIKIILAILTISLFAGISTVNADNNPPNPPQAPQPGDHPIGGSAPVGSGLVILLGLGAGYGAKKVYNYYKTGKEELEE